MITCATGSPHSFLREGHCDQSPPADRVLPRLAQKVAAYLTQEARGEGTGAGAA